VSSVIGAVLRLAAGVVATVMFVLVACSGSASAADQAAIDTPSAEKFEKELKIGEPLDGETLYDRFLENRKRLRSSYQEGYISSSDPAGNPQRTNFWMQIKDNTDENDDPVDGIYSKALFKVTGPFDMRHTGYLYIHRSDIEDEQFMYSPHRGRTSRVRLKGQSLAGTDFSFDDFLINLDDIEDAVYKRHPDETIDGVDCYVVEAVSSEDSKSSYSKSLVQLEKQHYVPLGARYWDEVGVEVKKLTSPHASIKEFDGAWLPTETTIVDLLEETTSTMYIEVLEPNVELDDGDFTISKLQFRP
jgi:hypothetical protein